MPIKTTCPNCDASYTLADTMRGKEVMCKSCQEAFTVPGTRPGNGAPYRDEDDEAVRTAPRRGPAPRDEDDDYPRRDDPRRRRPDDDEEDDYPRRGEQKKSKTGLIIGISLGALLLIGGGVTAFLLLGGKSEEDKLVEQLEKQFPEMPREALREMARLQLKMKEALGNLAQNDGFPGDGFPGDGLGFPGDRPKFPGDGPKFPGDGPKFPGDGPKFPGDGPKLPGDAPIPDGSRPQKQLTFADHLNNLKTGDDRAKSDAVSFFRNMDRNIPERAEIAKALEAYAQSKNGRSDIARVLCTWATKDQGATLVTYLQESGDGDRRQAAMAALAELKEERGVEPIIPRLGDAFDWTHAKKALENYGDVAQAGLARNRFHKNDNVRNHVKDLLARLNPPPEVIMDAAIKAAGSPDREVRVAAANWLSEVPVDEKSQPDVARALDTAVSKNDSREAALRALEIWATKDNVKTLAGLLNQNVRREAIIKILARLKDPDSAEALAARLPDGGDRPNAAAALKEIGPPAEKAVLAYFHHPDKGVQRVATDLLKGFGTKPEALLTQTLQDVSDGKRGRRRDAVEWLNTAELVESRRNDVVKAIEPVLEEPDRLIRDTSYKVYFRWLGPPPAGLEPIVAIVIGEKNDHRHMAMDALSKYKELKAAQAIASRLLHRGDREHASKCLKKMGQWAETPCVALMVNQKDRDVRIAAVHVLEAVGTKGCITYLVQSAGVHKKDGDYVRLCQNAAKAIQISGR